MLQNERERNRRKQGARKLESTPLPITTTLPPEHKKRAFRKNDKPGSERTIDKSACFLRTALAT
ncbi:hypothetical protein [Rhodocyclus tenuis]|uniref:hypothetical protein n=1 Tax=Rhodocyclus tenuis TaxID=1066 RepID=UPI00190819C6|nr:hypothetical protein [Rhodocyclus tenuis]